MVSGRWSLQHKALLGLWCPTARWPPWGPEVWEGDELDLRLSCVAVTKQRDTEMGQQSLLFQIDYPEIADGIMPRHRFMSAYEQRIEPPDRRWQYLLMAAEPYETIAFKVPSREIDKAEGKFWTHWNRETKQFFLQFHFKMEKPPAPPSLPCPPCRPVGLHPQGPQALPSCRPQLLASTRQHQWSTLQHLGSTLQLLGSIPQHR
ncbi:splicing factor 3a subunit 2 [Phyllostomus discolor]|uniref:Splicing factor 3a subunit 2 n=1 Tax=Phyllostomus discolor TaxID=89673 RepID=A0A834DUW3_9CHIR|nr:splicing factor 3a subunit 2 [Phyllostomus discolor]